MGQTANEMRSFSKFQSYQNSRCLPLHKMQWYWCCVWPWLESAKTSWSKQPVWCTSAMIMQLTGTKYAEIVEAFSYKRHAGNEEFLELDLQSAMRSMWKWKVCWTSTYNNCAIDWCQFYANMWSGLGGAEHTKYHLCLGRMNTHTHEWTDVRLDGCKVRHKGYESVGTPQPVALPDDGNLASNLIQSLRYVFICYDFGQFLAIIVL